MTISPQDGLLILVLTHVLLKHIIPLHHVDRNLQDQLVQQQVHVERHIQDQ